MTNKTAVIATLIIGMFIGAGAISVFKPGKSSSEPSSLKTDAAPSVQRPELAADGRLAVYLTTEEQGHVSEEMRAFLAGVQSISAAALEEDRATIRQTAQELAPGAGNAQGRAIQPKLPEAFRQLGGSLRKDFGAIEGMAETAPMSEIQQALSNALHKCVACHGAYNIVETSD